MGIGEVRKDILTSDFFLFSKCENAEGKEPTKFEDKGTEEKMIDIKHLRTERPLTKDPGSKKEGHEKRGQTGEFLA